LIIVFDLDDTLYDELSYILGGFRAVARYLSRMHHQDDEKIFKRLCDVKRKMGRGKVFDIVLDEIGIKSNTAVKQCLAVYRAHKPKIALHQDADACLNRLKHLQLCIVTDGNKIVQQRKIRALRLGRRIAHSYITHQYGLRNAKPSPYCFLKICEQERVPPNAVIYVADNPLKDFVGIKPLGFKTIRILRGPYGATKVKPSYDAHVTIRSLNQITERLLDRLIHA
jgi:putative hydrolase of the HAD superfamily